MIRKILLIFMSTLIILSSYSVAVAAETTITFNSENLLEASNVTAEELDDALLHELKGLGYKYVEMEEETSVNAIFIAAISALESGWGRSEMAKSKNNLFGFGKRTFESKEEGIEVVTEFLKKNYLSEDGRYFKGYSPEDVEHYYCELKNWGEKVLEIMYQIEGRILEYRKANSLKNRIQTEVEEMLIQNYENGSIIEEVNIFLRKDAKNSKDYINKKSQVPYIELNTDGKCDNSNVKVLKKK